MGALISGNVAVVSPYDNVALVNFTQSISHFRIGYSSWYTLVAEAYDADQGEYSEPGWWVMDNLTYESQTNPAIPGPCVALASMGLLLGKLRRFRQ